MDVSIDSCVIFLAVDGCLERIFLMEHYHWGNCYWVVRFEFICDRGEVGIVMPDKDSFAEVSLLVFNWICFMGLYILPESLTLVLVQSKG